MSNISRYYTFLIERGDQIRPLYHLAQQLLSALDISNESIKYYASLVTYDSVFRLKQLDEQIVYLYLLCFIYHRDQRRNDNLLKSLVLSSETRVTWTRQMMCESMRLPIYSGQPEASASRSDCRIDLSHALARFVDSPSHESYTFMGDIRHRTETSPDWHSIGR